MIPLETCPNITYPSRFQQQERADRIKALVDFQDPITDFDRDIVSQRIEHLVSGVQNGAISPAALLHTYGKIALKAHAKTNCATEILLDSAPGWLKDGSVNLKGPLAGIPVSLKDTVVVGGYDTTVGFSSFVGNKTPQTDPQSGSSRMPGLCRT